MSIDWFVMKADLPWAPSNWPQQYKIYIHRCHMPISFPAVDIFTLRDRTWNSLRCWTNFVEKERKKIDGSKKIEFAKLIAWHSCQLNAPWATEIHLANSEMAKICTRLHWKMNMNTVVNANLNFNVNIPFFCLIFSIQLWRVALHLTHRATNVALTNHAPCVKSKIQN